MTGFGSASGEGAGVAVQVEARSVNHRYLQVKTRLPNEFTALEPRIEALVRKRLERGSASVSVSVTRPGREDLVIDVQAARRYRQQVEELARELGIPGDLDLRVLLGLPGVVAGDATGARSEHQGKVVLDAVAEAIAGLVEMREREGRALERELGKHTGALNKVVARIEKRMPKIIRAAQDALRARIDVLLDGRTAVAESDLAREVALIADRGDVSEEIARLASHIAQIEERIASQGSAVGRQLDFLVQELFRELNTIGSKCGDAEVAHWVVEAKTTAERLREQVQNVE
jgi:uncharacterized protein (TIGR00255 family)